LCPWRRKSMRSLVHSATRATLRVSYLAAPL